MHKQKLFIIIAAAVGILGWILPWQSVQLWGISESASGFNSGWVGYATIAAIGAAVGVLFKDPERNNPIDADTKKIVMGAGGGAALFSLIAIILIGSRSGGAFGLEVSLGIGPFICLIGGLGILAVPFVVKADGEMSMPTTDSIKSDISGSSDSGSSDTSAADTAASTAAASATTEAATEAAAETTSESADAGSTEEE